MVHTSQVRRIGPATLVATALSLLVLSPVAARADTLLIPFLGLNFGGDAGKDFGTAVDAKQMNYGISFAFIGGGIFGFEADVGYSPDFFGKNDVGGSSVLTAMSNLILAIPFGGQQGFGIRPYGIAGIGIMKSGSEFGDVVDLDEETNFSWNAGGGVMLFFGNRFGMRFDVRFFQTFESLEILGVEIIEDSPGKLDFTRSSLGFIFRF